MYVFHPVNLPADLRKDLYYLLEKALYGLRQAPLRWFLKLREMMLSCGFKQLETNGALFIRGSFPDRIVVVLVYVDDLIVTGSSTEIVHTAIRELPSFFEGKDEGTLNWYLGVHFKKVTNTVQCSQVAYIDSLLAEHKLAESNAVVEPMANNFFDAQRDHDEDPVVQDQRYAAMVGGLIYLANRTRPDISIATAILAQYMSRPTTLLLKAARRVFAYLNATKDFCLTHKRPQAQTLELKFFVDSDHAADKKDRKSRTGWIGYLNNCAFTWYSRKQDSVSISTAEAEYIAMSDCCKEIRRVRVL